MTDAVVAGALTVAVLNAVPGVLGGWLWYRAVALDGGAGKAFWVLLRVGQGSALAPCDTLVRHSRSGALRRIAPRTRP